jgi:hypothetical protein
MRKSVKEIELKSEMIENVNNCSDKKDNLNFPDEIEVYNDDFDNGGIRGGDNDGDEDSVDDDDRFVIVYGSFIPNYY